MRKLLTIALALALAVSAAACSKSEQDAYEMYTKMNDSLASAKAMEIETSAKVGIAAAGQNMDITTTGTVKQVIRSATEVDMEMIMSTDVPGMGAAETTAYFKDGYMYQDMYGQKMKYAMDLDDAMAQANMTGSTSFPKEAIIESSVTDVTDGKQLSFTLDGSKVQDMIDDTASAMMESMGAGEMNLTIDSMTITAVVDKSDKPVSMNMVYTAKMEVEGVATEMDYNVDMKFLSIDGFDSIEFPADLDQYQDIGNVNDALTGDFDAENPSLEGIDPESINPEDFDLEGLDLEALNPDSNDAA